MAAAASASDSAAVRGFSGENEDGREYKRWKTWVKNKFLTLDKLPESARGAYIYTLLSGKALEAVEHVDPSLYQKKMVIKCFGISWTKGLPSLRPWMSWGRFWVRYFTFDPMKVRI